MSGKYASQERIKHSKPRPNHSTNSSIFDHAVLWNSSSFNSTGIKILISLQHGSKRRKTHLAFPYHGIRLVQLHSPHKSGI